jgi:hypothetical protein
MRVGLYACDPKRNTADAFVNSARTRSLEGGHDHTYGIGGREAEDKPPSLKRRRKISKARKGALTQIFCSVLSVDGLKLHDMVVASICESFH